MLFMSLLATLCFGCDEKSTRSFDAAPPKIDAGSNEKLRDANISLDRAVVPRELGVDAPLKPDAAPTSGGLYTSKNKIYLPSGKVFHGRGANIHDTRSCNACTWSLPNVAEVTRRVDELVNGWGANFLRLALESYGSAGGRTHYKGVLDDPAYLKDIQAIVAHIGKKPGVYVLLSIWVDPSLSSLGWPTAQTIKIWEKLAATFAKDKHVLFGLVNEPQSNFNGAQDAACWKAMNDAVAAIRKVESATGGLSHIITVQGTGGWARRMDYYITHPITAGGGKNVAYEVHVYDPISEFNKLFINPAKTLPVIIGEFGPGGQMTTADCTKLMDEAERLEIPHLAWTFHMRCPPNLLVENSGGGCGGKMKLAPTPWGTKLKQRLSKPW